MRIGDRIKQRREDLGLSVEDVAQKLGKHRATIYRYESNEIENMPADVLEPLATVLKTTPAALMGWENTENQVQALPQTEKFVALYTPAEISHIKKYRLLSDKDKQTVDSLLDSLITAAQTPIKVVAFGEGETTLSAHDWEIIKKAIEDQKNGS